LSEMQEWVAAASAELGLSPGDIPVDTVLDLARDVAHQVLRPGAPVTAYLMGLAVGRGSDPAAAAERLTALAASWPTSGSRQSAAPPSGSRQSEPEHIDPPIG
jgi:uncharacterized protein DUF6457